MDWEMCSIYLETFRYLHYVSLDYGQYLSTYPLRSIYIFVDLPSYKFRPIQHLTIPTILNVLLLVSDLVLHVGSVHSN